MNGLVDLLNIILSSIQSVDTEIIEKIAEMLPKTQLSYYAEVFTFALEYHKVNKEFPSPDFLQSRFPTWIKVTEPLSKEAINITLYELGKEAVITDAALALQARDVEQAKTILESSTTKYEVTETKVDDICNLYDDMNQLPEGLQIGVTELDNIYKNFSYGTNNFIAAPQKAGKTSAALSIVYDGIMRRGMNAVYLTLEVKPFDIYANLFARHAHEIGTTLSAQKVKKNLLDENERVVLGEVQRSFKECLEASGGKISVVANHDFPEFNFAYVKQYLEEKYEEWGRVDLVVIDHINLTGFYKMKGVSDMKERINTWIKNTTDLAKGFHDNGFILITLMQINRQGTILLKKGKTPDFSILADANEAERSAHTITVMYSNPEMLLANTVRLYCLANRNGPPLTSDEDDNSIETYLNPAIYLLGHRKYGDTIKLENKDLLKPENISSETTTLFGSMMGGFNG